MAKKTVEKGKFLQELRDSTTGRILAIWDGCFYFYRALCSTPPAQYKGFPIHAVVKSLQMICSDMMHLKPNNVAIVFDHPSPNFRHHIHPQYKAGLWSAPYEEQIQLHALQQLLRLLGFPLFCVQGVEGDDTIGTLAATAPRKLNCNTLIFTADKDLQVLVTPRVRTLDTRSNRFFYGTPASVLDSFGVPPALISDYLALVGDANDNIPGIPGCGPKKALALLQEHGSVAGIEKAALKAQESGKGGLVFKLLPSKPAVRDMLFAHSLTKVKRDVRLPESDFVVNPQVSADTIRNMWAASFGAVPVPPYVSSLIQRQSLRAAGSLFDTDTSGVSTENDGYYEMMGSLFANFSAPKLEVMSVRD